jgi:hypothetical protein
MAESVARRVLVDHRFLHGPPQRIRIGVLADVMPARQPAAGLVPA